MINRLTPRHSRSVMRYVAVGIALTVATAVSVADPATALSASSKPAGSPSAECSSLATCYTPHDLQLGYGIVPLLDRGINGSGETIVLPELAEPQFPLPTSDIRQDLAAFDKLFGLPRANLRSVTTLAPGASPWLAYGEEVLDTEVVHAIAPGAWIIELLVPATSLSSVANAVAAAASALKLGSTLGGIISISAAGQTGGEHCDTHSEVAALHASLQLAAKDHVTVVAASGDVGAVGEPCQLIKGLIGGAFTPVKEVNLPAEDPLVLAAGGTTLTLNRKTGAYESEVAWGLPFGNPGTQFQGSGGGLGHVFSRPAYQNGVPGISAYRGVPDVAANASPSPGFPVVTSTRGGQNMITGHGGTSASAPTWAGIVALADQYAGRHLGFVNAAIYRIARSASYHEAFHDITNGNNSVSFPPKTINGYQATSGWDAVTGWGSPDASVLVPLLVRNVRADDTNGL